MNSLLFLLSCKTPSQKTISRVGTSFLEFFRVMLKYPPTPQILSTFQFLSINKYRNWHFKIGKAAHLVNWHGTPPSCSYHLWQLGGKKDVRWRQILWKPEILQSNFQISPTHTLHKPWPQIESGIIQIDKIAKSAHSKWVCEDFHKQFSSHGRKPVPWKRW